MSRRNVVQLFLVTTISVYMQADDSENQKKSIDPVQIISHLYVTQSLKTPSLLVSGNVTIHGDLKVCDIIDAPNSGLNPCAQGSTGANGSIGAMGARGAQGATGSIGLTGPTGVDVTAEDDNYAYSLTSGDIAFVPFDASSNWVIESGSNGNLICPETGIYFVSWSVSGTSFTGSSIPAASDILSSILAINGTPITQVNNTVVLNDNLFPRLPSNSFGTCIVAINAGDKLSIELQTTFFLDPGLLFYKSPISTAQLVIERIA